jgi:CSLREA domain-containing protein
MAATFTANSTADLVDANPGDGVCGANPAGDCTLRAAIMEANALGGVRVQNADALITFSTLADNGSGVNVSYFSFDGLNLVGISASVLQNATADNCRGDLPTSAGYNLLDDPGCAFTATGDLPECHRRTRPAAG